MLGPASTVLAVADTLVSSWDLAGRPYALVRETGSYRRGLDGGLLLKREAVGDRPRLRLRLTPAEGSSVVEAARSEAGAALAALLRLGSSAGPLRIDACRRLERVLGMDTAALEADARRFLTACGPVGILPPDQYLSLVLRVTEGCSWNACTFCSLYRDVPFRFKPPPELVRHIEAVRAYFGDSLPLRHRVFLGDANALCLAQDLLLPLVETVATAFPGVPLASFVDAWTGRRKSGRDWQALRALGLRRVYVGLESGDRELLSWLGKAGAPADAVDLVAALHAGGVAAGIVVLLGAGGERFSDAHVEETAAALRSMRLGREDVVYFSEFVDDPSLRYARRAAGEKDLHPLPPERAAEQRMRIAAAVRAAGPERSPRLATYDIREFVY